MALEEAAYSVLHVHCDSHDCAAQICWGHSEREPQLPFGIHHRVHTEAMQPPGLFPACECP